MAFISCYVYTAAEQSGSFDCLSVISFRSTGSTVLHESGLFRSLVIERQLSHVDKNSVRASYNRAEYLPERREMMQWWADRLDILASR